MAFFDELSDKIINTSKTAVSKAKEVADITKLKTEIISEESRIRSLYAEIGKMFCEKEAGEIDPEYQPLLEKVAVSKAAIAEYKAEIQKIKGTCQCPECGAEAAADAQFCSACGAPIPPKDHSVEKEPLNEEGEKTASGEAECGCAEKEGEADGCGCPQQEREETECCGENADGRKEESCGCASPEEKEI